MPQNQNGAYIPDKDLFKESFINSLEQYRKLYNDSITNNSEFWGRQAHELQSC